MGNIVVGHPDKLDMKNADKHRTSVLANLNGVEYGKDNIFIPSSLLDDVNELENVNVYFELENDVSFQKLKAFMEKQDKPKGVFRYRRITKHDKDESLLAEDICAITSLFGAPESVFIKRTDRQSIPYHVIVTLDFGGGTMAHVEYTLSNKEQIELEWSGIEQILEFHSGEMNPLISEDNRSYSLGIKVESILNTSYPVDEKFLTHLEKCRNMLKDGVNK